MNEDELFELVADIKKSATNNQMLQIARDLILEVSKKCIDSEKEKKLLIANELIRMFA